jgi:hypothetical protein
MKGFDLLPKEVEAIHEIGVALGPFGSEVQVAVVAFSKDRDAFDLRVPERSDEQVAVELAPHVRYGRPGMEI